MPKLKAGMHVHLVGIGGVGLSAIARVLLQRGFTVSGSDRAVNTFTDALAQDGATIYHGHDAAHINGADVIIITSAAQAENPEITAAHQAGIPVYKRSEIIMDVINANLAAPPYLIGVAGTHGKTTTTGMIAHTLLTLGLKTGYIIGGTLSTTGTNADAGDGQIFVIEADEYDNMFHGLMPDIAVLTSVEWDHPDFFKTPADLTASFAKFIEKIAPDGLLIACGYERGAAEIAAQRARLQLPTVQYNRPEPPLHLNIPGIHNQLNGEAAVTAVAHALKNTVDPAQIHAALSSFNGTGRRFETMGEADGVIVINDYAHHPTAIRVTLDAARTRYPDRQIWAVWQPHTFSRTKALWGDYVAAFADADHVLVTDIYAAREQPLEGITSAHITADIAANHPDAHYTGSIEATAQFLIQAVSPLAVILLMSAGDAPQIGQAFLAQRR